MTPALPRGFALGHWTGRATATGCTVVLTPEGSVAAGEVRGGGPGTRESDLLTPAAAAPGIDALVLTGGSAFGLAAADGVMAWLQARGRGFMTPSGHRVPLVAAAVVFDLALGDGNVRPGAVEGAAACEAAGTDVERGNVGVGTGCTVAKLLGDQGWSKGGFGAATEDVEGCRVTALAAVNALGDVVGEDGARLAAPRHRDRMVPTAELLRAGMRPQLGPREATTLVAVLTDARLTKTEAWTVARAGSGGIARAVDPAATAFDGDACFCLAGGDVDADPLVLAAVVPHVVAAAIRDGVRSAESLWGCPAAPAAR